MKKKSGSLEYLIGLMMITILCILVLFGYRMHVIKTTKNYVEDGLAASNLAAAVIDLKEYGATNRIFVDGFSKAYGRYKEALADNLNLDADFMPEDDRLICGRVIVEEFAVYEVSEDEIAVTSLDENGIISKKVYPDMAGRMTTPDGALITTATIYSRIGFLLTGYSDATYYVHKENSVDITD
ncbi:hypothetical protein [Anaerobium acetethylicum]|uniref:Uncharacterized protein n=1 Tax=Anaerobium acetethylicum TaxID=1619234 RepID=A0A1D3TXJ9_9FIRM|nr:hypothetical protein [Anaerobium acetethylicum]SCP99059.1 hypothetical protein SAMN05421730_103133 [Anaerobium acetethylicum]